MASTKQKLFLSYAWSDDQPFVERLCCDLQTGGYDLWMDKQDMPSRGRALSQEVVEAIDKSDRMLAVMGPAAVKSQACQAEREFAFLRGKAVTAVLRLGDYRILPPEIARNFVPDFRTTRPYEMALQELLRILAQPPSSPGILFDVPALPPHFQPRPDLLTKLGNSILFQELSKAALTSQCAALHGISGVGKSVIAAAFARDYRTRRSFVNGVVWLKLGQSPDLLPLLIKLGMALGDDLKEYAELGQARLRASRALDGKECLLVLDDVWELETAQEFLNLLSPRCRLLTTTRDSSLASRLGAQVEHLDVLTRQSGLQLLSEWVGKEAGSLPWEAAEVAKECGYLPFALCQCGATVRDGISWADALQALREADVSFFAQKLANYEYLDVFKAIQASVSALSASDPQGAQHYFDLAVFPSGMANPEAAVITMWAHSNGMSHRKARKLIATLHSRAMIQRLEGEPPNPRLSLHDLQDDFIRASKTDLKGLHQRLLEAYQERCPNGWHTGPNDGYFFQHLRHHLIEAGRSDELVGLLLDLNWLEAKNKNGFTFDLPLEFAEARRAVRTNHPQQHFLALLEEALRRDIHFIATHNREYPQALFQSLWNSCWWYDCPAADGHYDPPLQSSHRKRRDPEPTKLHQILEAWRRAKERDASGFTWAKSVRPPPARLGTGTQLVLRGHTDDVTCVAFSPDGQFIVSGSGEDDRSLRVWSAQTGKDLRILRGHKSRRVECVAFSPDGDRIVSGGSLSDETVRVWDVKTGGELNCFHVAESPVRNVAFSVDGKHVYSWGGVMDCVLQVWSTVSNELIHRIDGPIKFVDAVAYSRDRSRFVTGSSDKTVRVWDTKTGEEIGCYCGHTGRVSAVSFSPDDRLVASGADWPDNTVRVWGVASGVSVACFKGHDAEVRCVAFSPDGSRLASASDDRTIRVWDVGSGKEVRCLQGHEEIVWSVMFSPDGSRILSGSRDRTLRVWDAIRGDRVNALPDHRDWLQSIDYSPDGRLIVSGSNDGAVFLWDAQSGRQLRCLLKSVGGLTRVVFSRTRDLVLGHSDYRLHVWDIGSGKDKWSFRSRDERLLDAVFSPSGHQIVTGSLNGNVRIRNADSGQEVLRFTASRHEVSHVSFSPDGSKVAAGSSQGVHVWSVHKRRGLFFLGPHPSFITSVSYSADGGKLVSGSYDGAIRVWDSRTGAQKLILETEEQGAYEVAFSSDGRKIIAACYQPPRVQIFDSETGCNIDCIEGRGDVSAIISTINGKLSYRAIARALETVIEDNSGNPISWFPVPLDHIATHPAGLSWAGASSVNSHLYIIDAEGMAR